MEKSLFDKCKWLRGYLKHLLSIKDLKTYNRVKVIFYYYPSMFINADYGMVTMALKYPSETYICLGANDERLNWIDVLYKEINGKEFDVAPYLEERCITLDDFFGHFGL